MTSLYIHIPFCLGKCPYCDFYSVAYENGLADRYIQTICSLLQSVQFPAKHFDTVYFGGGTPSLLSLPHISMVLDAAQKFYGIEPDAEITLEANPAATPDFRTLRNMGVNRLSIGVQSVIDSELAALGRLHTADEAETAILSAHAAGFDNISADLMLGVPGQTQPSLARSIDFLTAMPVSHISAYMLRVEEGTPFHRRGITPDDDLSADLYLQTVESLADKGFPQYEISSFARPGKQSRHNLRYWKLGDYLGLGPSAHSFLAGKRFSFSRDLPAFLTDPLSQLIEEGPGGDAGEFIMLSLRLIEGLDINLLETRYRLDSKPVVERARPFLKSNLAKMEKDRLYLTPEGFLLSNTIIGALLEGLVPEQL